MDRIPAHVTGIVAGIRAIGMDPPAAVAQAERTRAALLEEMQRAQQASSEVDPSTLRTRFAEEAFVAADSGKPLPHYAEELARLEAQLRWRRIAVDALSDAVDRAAWHLQSVISDELPAVYELLRTALSDALAKVRHVAPAMASMPLDAAEEILRSGDRKAVSAYADLADASDVIGHVRTVQRHLRTLQAPPMTAPSGGTTTKIRTSLLAPRSIACSTCSGWRVTPTYSRWSARSTRAAPRSRKPSRPTRPATGTANRMGSTCPRPSADRRQAMTTRPMYDGDYISEPSEVRRDKRRASGFQPDPEMERLIADPSILDRLEARSPGAAAAQRTALGFYRSARAAHERTEGDAA